MSDSVDFDEIDDMGGCIASNISVSRYLQINYDLSREKAGSLVEKHKELIDQGNSMGSFSYYVANKIAVIEGL